MIGEIRVPPPPIGITKVCSVCGEEKDLSLFSRRELKDTWRSECKACQAADARRRRADPVSGQQINERRRARAKQTSAQRRSHQAALRKRHFFVYRARSWNARFKLKGDGRVTAWQLARLWISQRGRCALSGRLLAVHSELRNGFAAEGAQLDHRVAAARGGSHSIKNLWWVDAEINRAKRDLDEREFVLLCRQVAEWTE